jgi:SSS family solute:Na+ symporter
VSVHLALLAIFVVLQVGVGLYIGRRTRGASDFFVAGRGLPPFLVFAGSTVNASSLGYRFGLSAWWWNGSAGIGSIALGLWLGPKLWRLAREHGYLTAGDFLEARYGSPVRAVSTALIWVCTLWVLTAQLIGASRILEVVAGLPRYAGALVGGAVMVTYFVAGGLLASAWVNLVQLVVLLGGFLIAVPLALATVGGWEGLRATAGIEPTAFSLISPEAPWLGWFLLLAPAFVVSPGLLQKAYGASSARAVRLGVTANGVALLAFAFLPATLGLVARTHHPDLTSPELALPMLLVHQLPTIIGALTLSAVFAAEVSSADAILFMLATSFGRDLYHRFLRPDATEAQVLLAARAAAIVGGGAGIVLALAVPTIVGALQVFYGILTVVLFVPVVAAVLSDRPGPVEAAFSIGAGLSATTAVYLATAGAGLAGWSPFTIGLAASGVACVTVFGRRLLR